MKKGFLIVAALVLLAGKAFSFEIGGAMGYGFGEMKGTITVNDQETIEQQFYQAFNIFVMFPHKYGEKGWGGKVDVGFIDLHVTANYAVSYTWNAGAVELSPFVGLGLVFPLGLTSFAGCSVEVPVGIGNIYCDLRFGSSFGLLYGNQGLSINAGYVFRFGKDR